MIGDKLGMGRINVLRLRRQTWIRENLDNMLSINALLKSVPHQANMPSVRQED